MFSFLTILLLYKRGHVQVLVWVIVVSLGFYGLKGGIFVVASGGEYRVWGPPGSFIEDNNGLALALIMVLPLMWYLYSELNKRWQKIAMLVVMVATGFSILGSHSRGAALAGSSGHWCFG